MHMGFSFLFPWVDGRGCISDGVGNTMDLSMCPSSAPSVLILIFFALRFFDTAV